MLSAVGALTPLLGDCCHGVGGTRLNHGSLLPHSPQGGLPGPLARMPVPHGSWVPQGSCSPMAGAGGALGVRRACGAVVLSACGAGRPRAPCRVV